MSFARGDVTGAFGRSPRSYTTRAWTTPLLRLGSLGFASPLAMSSLGKMCNGACGVRHPAKTSRCVLGASLAPGGQNVPPCARDRPSMRHPIRPKKGPFWGLFDASRTETRRSVFDPQKREKKGTCEDTRAMMDTHARLFPPVGIGGMFASIARMKNLRSHRALLRVEFSFGITSHKNYYVNSRVKNEETSAFEAN